MTPMSKQKFAVLDGMRGIAALFILTRHTSNFWDVWLYKSYLAVDLFFILSGFVIAHAYDQKLQRGVLTNKDFFAIRIIRLAPVYLMALALAVAMALVSGYMDSEAVSTSQIMWSAFFALFFLPSHVVGIVSLFPLIGPAWSLFFELIANFLYVGLRARLTEKAMPTLLVVLGLLVCFCSYMSGGLDNGFIWGPRSIGTGLARVCFGFLFGLYLYKKRTTFALAKYTGVLPTVVVPVVVLAVILCLPNLHRFNWMADVLCVAVVFPALVLLAASATKIPGESLLLALGSSSYPIYVFHQPIGKMLTMLFPEAIKSNAPWSGVVFVLILVPATILLERRFDVPIRRYLTKLATSAPKRVAVP